MKTFLSAIVTLCLVAGVFVSSVSAVVSFDDVPLSYRFADEIVFLHSEGVIDGYPDATFRPEVTVSRAQAAKFIGDAIGLDGTPRETQFTDVPDGSAFSGYIQSAYEAGIISGYSPDTFRPHQPLERQHVALMLTEAFDFPQLLQESFSDVGPGMVAYEAIAKLANFGVAQGYPDGTFRPTQHVTRAQFAAFLARAYEPYFIPEKRELLSTANDLLTYLQNENFDAVEDYVDDEGLTFCPYAGSCIDDGGVTMTEEQVEDFMTDSTEYLWGYEAGSGFEIDMTPAEYYNEYLLDADYEEKTMYGREGHSMTRELVRRAFPEGTIVEFYSSGAADEELDWQSLNMVFEEEQDGEWALIALVNDRWTP